MDQDDIRALYDGAYADAYDERFLVGPPWARLGSDYEVEALGLLLAERRAERPPRWLDVACGTGWFLSRFPDEERSGLDLSPAMAARARSANPGVEIVEGSYLDPRPEWDAAWDLVSCMWFAYAYVDTVDQVEQVLDHLGRWTRPGGTCFLPVGDLRDLTGGIDVPYRNDETWTFGGPLRVVATVWSWTDDVHGKDHRRLVSPHVDHLIEVLGRWFAEVEVVHYPPLQPGWDGRRALVGHRRRSAPHAGPATEVTHRVEPYRGPDGPDADLAADAADEPAADEPGTDGVGGTDPIPTADEPTQLADEAEDQTPRPPGRSGRAWRAWDRVPRPLHTAARSAWRAVPAGLRRRLGTRLGG